MSKGELRIKYKAILNGLSLKRRAEAKGRLLPALKGILAPYRRVFSFTSMNDEIDLSEVNRFLQVEGRLCLNSHEEYDCILVPGLAFDRKGVRLGRGWGYYDKLLAKYENIDTIGLCFREQLSLANLPKEPHDQLVKKICAF